MKKPFISIIVPCYNCQDYVDQTLNSIIDQTCKDFELIFLDDGSTDRSLIIANHFLKDSNIEYSIYSYKNQGVSKTRNIGIQKARGEYIYFLDSDDTIDLNLVLKAKDYLTKSKADMLLFKYHHKGTISKLDSTQTVLNNLEAISSFCKSEININMCSFIVKRSLIMDNQILFTEGARYGEDHELILKLLYHSKEVQLLNNVLFYYNCRPGSAVNSYTISRLDSLDFANRVCKYIISKEPQRKDLKLDLIQYFMGKVDYNISMFIQFKGYKEKELRHAFIKQTRNYLDVWLDIKTLKVQPFSKRRVRYIVMKKNFIIYYLYLKKRMELSRLKQFIK